MPKGSRPGFAACGMTSCFCREDGCERQPSGERRKKPDATSGFGSAKVCFMTSTSARSLNEAVAHASAILGADPRRARRAAEAILAQAPRDPRALLVLGSAKRRLGD